MNLKNLSELKIVQIYIFLDFFFLLESFAHHKKYGSRAKITMLSNRQIEEWTGIFYKEKRIRKIVQFGELMGADI